MGTAGFDDSHDFYHLNICNRSFGQFILSFKGLTRI